MRKKHSLTVLVLLGLLLRSALSEDAYDYDWSREPRPARAAMGSGDMITVIDYEYGGSYTTQVVSPSSTVVPLPSASSTVVPLPSSAVVPLPSVVTPPLAITGAVCSLVAFIFGTLCGALLTLCISRWNKKGHSSKQAPNTLEQQQATVVYEEVDTLSKKIELKENVAYGPVKQDQQFELKENVAYGPAKLN